MKFIFTSPLAYLCLLPSTLVNRAPVISVYLYIADLLTPLGHAHWLTPPWARILLLGRLPRPDVLMKEESRTTTNVFQRQKGKRREWKRRGGKEKRVGLPLICKLWRIYKFYGAELNGEKSRFSSHSSWHS